MNLELRFAADADDGGVDYDNVAVAVAVVVAAVVVVPWSEMTGNSCRCCRSSTECFDSQLR